jgi:hypothetical protein
MLVVGGRSAEEHFNVTVPDWQFLRLRLFVTGGRKTGAQLRVELLQGNAPG